ncbi:uncharacterized protein LOC124865234 isoform X2 [Girardinichthys multiradiatus]|uniref:uncharacterized protein LOC124865213 n=1 Tax=Girardinichthys multiradiatus TaxID=208333 RepID=UPI001FADBF84|nr:uncharacterized protein LOC124862446 isoform X2 [Girardinichthys multiradiatus]XP_047216128.1 uncharacterized protein LOC124865213 [Girardinichthys multiradiatus]XP_047216148.1 uncharacterized protein LOC124865234 isoform X2 [Girardinichthys multiradiatus]
MRVPRRDGGSWTWSICRAAHHTSPSAGHPNPPGSLDLPSSLRRKRSRFLDSVPHDQAVGRVIAINNLTNSWSVNEAGANIKHLRHTVCNLWTYVAIFNFPPLLTMKALM